jgi:hypothetical protein
MRAPLCGAAIAACAPMEIVAPPHIICLVASLAVRLAGKA